MLHVSACFLCIHKHKQGRHSMLSYDILHRCLWSHKPVHLLFLGRLPCLPWSSREQKDFSEKDITQTPSMFPPRSIIVRLTADPDSRLNGRSKYQHESVSLYSQTHLQASTFEHGRTMLIRGYRGVGLGGDVC